MHFIAIGQYMFYDDIKQSSYSTIFTRTKQLAVDSVAYVNQNRDQQRFKISELTYRA